MNIFLFLMPKATITYLYSDNTIRQALEKMEKYRFTTLPIINDDGTYFGSIAEGDILWFIKQNDQFSIRDCEKCKISDINRYRSYRGINIDCSMEELMDCAINQNFVPMLDDRGVFIGIIRRRDLLDYYVKNASDKNE